MTYIVELPLPPTCCGANYKADCTRTRIHDGQRKAAYRQECADKIKQAARAWKTRLPFTVPVWVHFDWYCGRGGQAQQMREVLNPVCRPRDVGNAIAAVKVATDAFIDAKVLTDDDYRHVPFLTARIFGCKEEHGGRAVLCVTIQVASQDADQILPILMRNP